MPAKAKSSGSSRKSGSRSRRSECNREKSRKQKSSQLPRPSSTRDPSRSSALDDSPRGEKQSQKRPISRRRIRANRRNAKKSTGPKTEAGKRIVSKNALRHGLLSERFPTLPYEDDNEYREFADAMERDLRPVGVLERQVASQITQTCWKLRRCPAIEAALMEMNRERAERCVKESFENGEYEDCGIEQPNQLPRLTAAELIAANFAGPDPSSYERLELYRMRLERGLDSAMRHLKRLREQTAGEEISGSQEGRYLVADIQHLNEQVKQARRDSEQNAPGLPLAASRIENVELVGPPSPKRCETPASAAKIDTPECHIEAPKPIAVNDLQPVERANSNKAVFESEESAPRDMGLRPMPGDVQVERDTTCQS